MTRKAAPEALELCTTASRPINHMLSASAVVPDSSLPAQASRPASTAMCAACGSDDARELLCAPDHFNGLRRSYALLRCPHCALVWLQNSPSPSDMPQHYGSEYDAFIKTATDSESGEHWRNVTTTLQRFKRGGALLDLGCGCGSFLATLDHQAWQLYGVEMSADSADAARKRTGAEVFTGDILAARFPAGHFDVITCLHVLEHVYDPVAVLRRAWSWLKPGGILLVEVPNIDAAERKLFRSFWYPLELPRHLYHFSSRSLRHLAALIGYREQHVIARRVSFFEHSSRYVVDASMRRLGIARPPLGTGPPATLAWRVIRKALRLSVLLLISRTIALFGEGQIIEAVLQKPTESEPGRGPVV
jgi:2-polyprenyl-3-methyl-5-hydroxy-6-metoxy-1,4-benzoquinol methylase